MRIAEYKQISTELVEQEITIPAEYDDEEGNIISEERTEIVAVERPVMGVVYRDMSPEEEAEMAQNTDAIELSTNETEDRIAMLEECILELASLLGGNEQ